MSTWQPQPQGLSQILQLLQESYMGGPKTPALQEKLEAMNHVVDYNNYLAYILTHLGGKEDPSTRAVAGLMLKNNIRVHYEAIQPQVMLYVKAAVLQALGDQENVIRNTAGNVITTVVTQGGLEEWPELIPTLMEMADKEEGNWQEGSVSALRKICEDSAFRLDQEAEGNRPLNYLIPKLISLVGSPSERIRANALSCVNQFILMRTQALMVNMDQFVSTLFSRAQDPSAEVRKHICQALVMLLEVRPDKLMPVLGQVVEYMLYSTQDSDEYVALEACEFWLAFAEQEELRENLKPYLANIVPVLLKGMVYTEMDIIQLGGDEDDTNVPDAEQDIKPRHHKAKAVTHDHTAEEGVDGDSEDEDEDDEDDEFYTEWNLRKCSAASLDVLATVFQEDLLVILLPVLQRQLETEEWEQRESGILALGAIAEGCMKGIEPHLPQLVPFLIQQLGHPKPLVRTISCWTLGRYSRWCATVNDQNTQKPPYLEPLMEGLLRMILDRNKRVQEAGCGAFATLEEEAGAALVPYLDPILKNLVHAFNIYQHKNLMLLYDAIGALAEAVNGDLKEYTDILMPPLINQWQILSDDDRALFPLLECLSAVTTAVGLGFQPYAQPVFERCVKLVNDTLVQLQMHQQNPALELPDKDFMIVALDLLSSLVQGLNAAVEPLVASANPPLLQLLGMAMNDPVAEVRQSSFALLGDLAISCFAHLRPFLSQIIPRLIQEIDPAFEFVSVCNNASWAAGEIALQYGSEMQPYVQPLIERLVPLLIRNETVATQEGASQVPQMLLENVAITIGRLGLVCPQMVAPHLETFVGSWCKALRSIRDNDEKESAYKGLCEMIQANPQGVVKDFAFFCDAVTNWNTPSQELNEKFRTILNGFHQMIGPEHWQSYVANFPPVVGERLRARYQL